MTPAGPKVKRNAASTPGAGSKVICENFYIPTKDSLWQCKKCEKMKKKNGGWTNLLTHLRSCVGPDFEAQFELAKKSSVGVGTLREHFVPIGTKEKEMCTWIQLLVMKNFPPSFVDCPLFREMTSLKPVCSTDMEKHLLALARLVKETIKKRLTETPTKLVLVLDGWTEGTDHYMGLTVSYNVTCTETGKQVPEQVLLSINLLHAQEFEEMTATDYMDHITKVLNSYGRLAHKDIICIVGSNCDINRQVAVDLGVPFIGCASHKLNLAVCLWIQNYPQLPAIIEKVSSVMKRARTVKGAAKLPQVWSHSTDDNNDNDASWLSTFTMLSRFLKIQSQLREFDELAEFLPTQVEMDILSTAHLSLSKFHQVRVMLQRQGIPFVEVRHLFDAVLDDFPELGHHHLSDSATIVTNPIFEKAIMRIAEGMYLTEEQQSAVECLLRPVVQNDNGAMPKVGSGSDDESGQRESDNYALKVERRIKRQKWAIETGEHYINLDVLPGTSVNSEKLAKDVVLNTRRTTSPRVFEALLFLKVNKTLWNVHDVGVAMRQSTTTGARGLGDWEDDDDNDEVIPPL